MAGADHRLNVLGLACPLPVLLAIRDLAALAPGAILEIVGDDPGMLEDIPQWCAKAGHLLLEMDADEGVIVCRVAKALDSRELPTPNPLTSPA